jgi:hypothetical protein
LNAAQRPAARRDIGDSDNFSLDSGLLAVRQRWPAWSFLRPDPRGVGELALLSTLEIWLRLLAPFTLAIVLTRSIARSSTVREGDRTACCIASALHR